MEKNSTLKHSVAFTNSEKKNPTSVELNSSVQPSQMVINNVLNYSKALNVQKTKKFGYLEFVTN